MPNLKHTVVVIENDVGQVLNIAKVRNVDDRQLADYQNKKKQYEQLELKRIAEETENKQKVYDDIAHLKLTNFHLAKSIYDNFVDRGLINDNSDFQKAYYDYVFNGKEIKIEDTPTDFQTIYRKVCD